MRIIFHFATAQSRGPSRYLSCLARESLTNRARSAPRCPYRMVFSSWFLEFMLVITLFEPRCRYPLAGKFQMRDEMNVREKKIGGKIRGVSGRMCGVRTAGPRPSGRCATHSTTGAIIIIIIYYYYYYYLLFIYYYLFIIIYYYYYYYLLFIYLLLLFIIIIYLFIMIL